MEWVRSSNSVTWGSPSVHTFAALTLSHASLLVNSAQFSTRFPHVFVETRPGRPSHIFTRTRHRKLTTRPHLLQTAPSTCSTRPISALLLDVSTPVAVAIATSPLLYEILLLALCCSLFDTIPLRLLVGLTQLARSTRLRADSLQARRRQPPLRDNAPSDSVLSGQILAL
jgi:hypothetical protein